MEARPITEETDEELNLLCHQRAQDEAEDAHEDDD